MPNTPSPSFSDADRLRIAAELHGTTLAVLKLVGHPPLTAAPAELWVRVEGRCLGEPAAAAYLAEHVALVEKIAQAEADALKDTFLGAGLEALGQRLQRPPR